MLDAVSKSVVKCHLHVILPLRIRTRAFKFPPHTPLRSAHSRPLLIVPPGHNKIGAIAQLGERYNGIVEVSGSIPLGSTIKTPWETKGFCLSRHIA